MALPIQTVINTHEALSDWRFTAQEANQVIAGVWEGVIGMIVITAMMGVFNMVVGGNPGKEPRNPKQLNAPGFRLEQTTIDEEVIDGLEHTWHRIDSDMSVRMQEALGILKEVMSYRYEQPVVVAWDNGDLVGIAVYETVHDKDLGVQDTHISELASFTYKPGVGKLLVEEVIRIGKREGSDAVTASHAPGKRRFYERMGFVRDYRYPGAPTLMMYKLKSGNPTSSSIPDSLKGTCYQDAWRFAIKGENATLVHGIVVSLGRRIGHAWVELPTGYVWEPSSGARLTYERFKELVDPTEEARYTAEQAAIMAARTGHTGPWTTEERNKFLSFSKSNPGSIKLYHCTASENVSSIMRQGLFRSGSEFIFFFPNLQVAEEAGLSGMAILEVSITDDEIDKCTIGETFPDLYTERFGGEPPADMSLREYTRNPIAYGIPEVCCTIPRIPAGKIKYVKTIRH